MNSLSRRHELTKQALVKGIALANVSDAELAEIDAHLLDADGRLRLLSASEVRSVGQGPLRLWMHHKARYLIPTLELIAWLNERIEGRQALEVGAGNADLGFLLGIQSTDSYQQSEGPLAAFYQFLRQPPTQPGPDVLKMDALEAVEHFLPEVVVGSWITRKFINGQDVDGKADANIGGPHEETLISRVKTYIHIGCRSVHGTKTALSLPHEEIHFPWIVSRADYRDQSDNVIYVWDAPNVRSTEEEKRNVCEHL